MEESERGKIWQMRLTEFPKDAKRKGMQNDFNEFHDVTPSERQFTPEWLGFHTPGP